MTHTLTKLFLAAVLAVPFAASADHDDDDDDDDRRRPVAHLHDTECRHEHRVETPPRPPPSGEGRYELRTVQHWVEGHYEQVWVPERCRYKRNGQMKCRSGFYEERYVPGRYESVQQWVWVPAPVRRYDLPPRPPRPVYSHADFGVHFGG